MRAIRYVVGLLACTGWFGGRVIFAALFGERRKHGGLFDRCQQGWGRALLRLNRVRVEIEGGQYIDPNRPAVYVSNHASFIDIWALLDSLPSTIRFVAKKEFTRFPVIGQAMSAMGHVFIDRANRSSAFSAYDDAAAEIKRGTSVVVFAEGTRSRDGRLLPFKKGPFVLAIAAGAPIIPVYCHNTNALLPKGRVSPKPGTVTIRVSAPIPTAGLSYDSRDALAARARQQMLALGATE